MAPKRSFLDRSAAQKLVDPAIHRGIALHGLSARLDTARANSVGLGALSEDVDIDEIRRQAEENASAINSYQQQLLAQDDQRNQLQEMQHQLDNVLTGLNAEGTLPAVTRSKAQSQAQRIACLQYLADTKKDASPEELERFPGLVTAAQEPERLVPGDRYTEEHIMWALGSDTAMVKDFWTMDEVFEALVSARRVVDKVDDVKARNRELWDMISQGKSTIDSNFAITSSALQSIKTTGQETAKTTQETAKASQRVEYNVQMLIDALGPSDETGSDLKRRRPSVQFANAGASITRPSTAPPPATTTTPRRTLPTRQSTRLVPSPGAFAQIPSTLQGQTPAATQSTLPSAASSAEPETTAESDTVLETGNNIVTVTPVTDPILPAITVSIDVNDDIATTLLRRPNEVLSSNAIKVGDGSEQIGRYMPFATGLGAAVTKRFAEELVGIICVANDERYEQLPKDVNKTGCMYNKMLRGGAQPEDEWACPLCVKANRICLKKGKLSAGKFVMFIAPIRNARVPRHELAHWVSDPSQGANLTQTAVLSRG
ncbi:hypothetical protein KCU93_g6293, partial [Aureobasidium melanogenum]